MVTLLNDKIHHNRFCIGPAGHCYGGGGGVVREMDIENDPLICGFARYLILFSDVQGKLLYNTLWCLVNIIIELDIVMFNYRHGV